eukprot:2640098-Rhodomonas_salina.1
MVEEEFALDHVPHHDSKLPDTRMSEVSRATTQANDSRTKGSTYNAFSIQDLPTLPPHPSMQAPGMNQPRHFFQDSPPQPGMQHPSPYAQPSPGQMAQPPQPAAPAQAFSPPAQSGGVYNNNLPPNAARWSFNGKAASMPHNNEQASPQLGPQAHSLQNQARQQHPSNTQAMELRRGQSMGNRQVGLSNTASHHGGDSLFFPTTPDKTSSDGMNWSRWRSRLWTCRA